MRCRYCAAVLSPRTATIDHVIPLSRGGRNTHSNRVLACAACNRAKGALMFHEWQPAGSEARA